MMSLGDLPSPAPIMRPPADWEDGQSIGASSEVSVAGLQDRILQMEETHYSTSEELAATLQELADLQSQLAELGGHNSRLQQENAALVESLCRQTQRLEESQARNETLQDLLLLGCNDRDTALHELMKGAKERQEGLVLVEARLKARVHELEGDLALADEEAQRAAERIQGLEADTKATRDELGALEMQLAEAHQAKNSLELDNQRLTAHLENQLAKVEELEAQLRGPEVGELEQRLEALRAEKESLESRLSNMQQQLCLSQAEASRTREQVDALQDECQVLQNRCEAAAAALEQERADLEQAAQNNLEAHSRQLQGLLADEQQRVQRLETELVDERKQRRADAAEWEQFQSDLLVAVRVANEHKMEAELERSSLQERVTSLQAALDALTAQQKPAPAVASVSPLPRPISDSGVDILASRVRTGVSRQESQLSVKNIVESIENASKSSKPGRSRSGSTSSVGGEMTTPIPARRVLSNIETSGDGSSNNSLPPKAPLRDQQQLSNQTSLRKLPPSSITDKPSVKSEEISNNIISSNMPLSSVSSVVSDIRRSSYSDLSERKDPLWMLVRNGGSKRNALLKWCQHKTVGYRNIDITNFSSSWNDGLALCALLHSYLPDRVPYDTLSPSEKRRNFTVAFAAAESVGIPTTLNVQDMIQSERPDWNQVMAYVTAIYRHFET